MLRLLSCNFRGNDILFKGIDITFEGIDIIFEGIESYVPQKILSKNPDLEYYNKEVYFCCSMYCFCVNVHCTTATGCKPNCS